MSLVAMAVYATPENNRIGLTSNCLKSMAGTVNWEAHDLYVIDNGSIDEMKLMLEHAKNWLPFKLITNAENRGTARAINQGWIHRVPNQHCVKCDDDILYHDSNWLDRLEDAINRDPKIGIIGLKRTDLAESPDAPKGSWSHSDLLMLKHKPGENWIIVECARHILGSCTLYNSALLDVIGYGIQFKQGYGLDDSIACTRSEVAGFYNCFLPHIRISHPDPGGTSYQKWKEAVAGECLPKFDRLRMAYKSGALSTYHGPDDNLDEILKGWK